MLSLVRFPAMADDILDRLRREPRTADGENPGNSCGDFARPRQAKLAADEAASFLGQSAFVIFATSRPQLNTVRGKNNMPYCCNRQNEPPHGALSAAWLAISKAHVGVNLGLCSWIFCDF